MKQNPGEQIVNTTLLAHNNFPKETLCLWMRHMEEYGQVWHEDIGREFFSQEYWYLLVIAMVYYWRHLPLNVGDACNTMKTGSAKTRDNRLRKLFESHWLQKSKNTSDKRQTCVAPTPDMQRIIGAHLQGSLVQATSFARQQALLAGDGRHLAHELDCTEGKPDQRFLLPWAEFLVDYTDDWNATFNARFHTEEYWYPFVHCLTAYWAGRPLTMSQACQTMRTGSNRTRENRIAIAITRDLLSKRKSEIDMRTTLVLPTLRLERCLVDHFCRTLTLLLEMLGNLSSLTAK